MERCKSVVEAVQSACGGVRAHCTCVLSNSPAPLASGRIRGRAGPPSFSGPPERGRVPAVGVQCSICSLQAPHSSAPRPHLPCCHQPAPPVKQPAVPSLLMAWGLRTLGWPSGVTLCSGTPCACRVRAVASSARCPSRGDTRPVGPWGGTSRASRRYALVPEPKIAGDARRCSAPAAGKR